MKRGAYHGLELRAAAVDALADLLRATDNPRDALAAWHAHVPLGAVDPLRRVAQRLALGAPTGASLDAARELLGDDADTLATVLALQRDLGGDAAAAAAELARSVSDRSQRAAAGRAAGAGALLSARVVAALPLLFLPLVPLARAPMLDRIGLLLLVVGGALAVAGLRWVNRLMPTPRLHDPAATAATATAAALAGGASLAAVLDRTSASETELHDAFRTARRRVALGLRWRVALARSHEPSLRALGVALQRGDDLGLPVASSLRHFAAARHDEVQRAFDEALRRAPVLMVIPLAVCVLPSFLLLGLVPFLRGLALTP